MKIELIREVDKQRKTWYIIKEDSAIVVSFSVDSRGEDEAKKLAEIEFEEIVDAAKNPIQQSTTVIKSVEI
jgi:hypothetical protein